MRLDNALAEFWLNIAKDERLTNAIRLAHNLGEKHGVSSSLLMSSYVESRQWTD